MRYQNPRLRKALAGEYALGTLAGRARRRFEGLLVADAALRTEVRFWEERFARLDAGLKPVTPREVVWINLASRLGSSASAPAKSSDARLRVWRSLAGLATAASALLAVALWQQLQKPPAVVIQEKILRAESYVALLQVPQSDMRWTVSVTPAAQRVAVLAAGTPPAAAAGKDAELWLITDAGPASLGVIPKTGSAQRALPAGLSFVTGQTLAVSLEPAGGSPTGSPTGPVVVTGQVVATL